MGWNYSASYNLKVEKIMKINARFSGLCFEFVFLFFKESEINLDQFFVDV